MYTWPGQFRALFSRPVPALNNIEWPIHLTSGRGPRYALHCVGLHHLHASTNRHDDDDWAANLHLSHEALVWGRRGPLAFGYFGLAGLIFQVSRTICQPNQRTRKRLGAGGGDEVGLSCPVCLGPFALGGVGPTIATTTTTDANQTKQSAQVPPLAHKQKWARKIIGIPSRGRLINCHVAGPSGARAEPRGPEINSDYFLAAPVANADAIGHRIESSRSRSPSTNSVQHEQRHDDSELASGCCCCCCRGPLTLTRPEQEC